MHCCTFFQAYSGSSVFVFADEKLVTRRWRWLIRLTICSCSGAFIEVYGAKNAPFCFKSSLCTFLSYRHNLNAQDFGCWVFWSFEFNRTKCSGLASFAPIKAECYLQLLKHLIFRALKRREGTWWIHWLFFAHQSFLVYRAFMELQEIQLVLQAHWMPAIQNI